MPNWLLIPDRFVEFTPIDWICGGVSPCRDGQTEMMFDIRGPGRYKNKQKTNAALADLNKRILECDCGDVAYLWIVDQSKTPGIEFTSPPMDSMPSGKQRDRYHGEYGFLKSLWALQENLAQAVGHDWTSPADSRWTENAERCSEPKVECLLDRFEFEDELVLRARHWSAKWQEAWELYITLKVRLIVSVELYSYLPNVISDQVTEGAWEAWKRATGWLNLASLATGAGGTSNVALNLPPGGTRPERFRPSFEQSPQSIPLSHLRPAMALGRFNPTIPFGLSNPAGTRFVGSVGSSSHSPPEVIPGPLLGSRIQVQKYGTSIVRLNSPRHFSRNSSTLDGPGGQCSGGCGTGSL